MTWSDTQKEIDRVFGEYQEKKRMILYRYLLSRNQVKVGDIVESHNGHQGAAHSCGPTEDVHELPGHCSDEEPPAPPCSGYGGA